MLCNPRSYAFRLSEHCFQTLGAMLLDSQSIALDYKEHASGPYRAMLPMIWSSALMSTKVWRIEEGDAFAPIGRSFSCGILTQGAALG